jgi:murein DD-endopeptidase MepM/ murein hydrolase activator NlpD
MSKFILPSSYTCWLFALLLMVDSEVHGQFNTIGIVARMSRDTPVGKVEKKDSIAKDDSIFWEEPHFIKPSLPKLHPPLAKLRVTSGRGWRTHPVTGNHAFHEGIDLRAYFEPVYAIMDGRVEDVGEDDRSGSWIRLRHKGGMLSSYAHLSRRLVSKGDLIRSGGVIAVSGNSGRSTAPHLHFRIYYE